MVDPRSPRRFGHMALFAAIALATMFLRLLPVSPMAHGLPGPDLMVAFTFAWLLRRPEFTPPLLIVAVFLVEDLVYWRPIGLWTLTMLAGTEFLRSRLRPDRPLSLPVETLVVGLVMLAMLMAGRLLLGLALVEQPPLTLELERWLMTLVAYPFVVWLSQLAFGLRRPAPGETILGGRGA